MTEAKKPSLKIVTRKGEDISGFDIAVAQAQAAIDYGSQTTDHDAKIAEAFEEAHTEAGNHPAEYPGITSDGKEVSVRVELAHDKDGSLVASPNTTDVQKISENTQGIRKSIHN